MNTSSIIRLGKTTNHGEIANSVTSRNGSRKGPSPGYPEGCIGADLPRRDYIKYLVDRYHNFGEAQKRLGVDDQRFNYAVIYRHIESTFQAPTFFVPMERFEELVRFLTARIDRTILGRRNKARNIPNYSSFEEYQTRHVVASQSTA